MTSKAKRLGTGLEDRVVRKAKEKGLRAEKQPGSGVYQRFKSDAVIEQTLVECKVRSVEIDAKGQKTFRVDMDWWRGVQKNAALDGYSSAALVMNAKYSDQPMALIPLDEYLNLLSQAHGVDRVKAS